MKANRCSLCGRFIKVENLYGISGESDDCGNYETWFECIDCLCEADLEHFGLKESNCMEIK